MLETLHVIMFFKRLLNSVGFVTAKHARLLKILPAHILRNSKVFKVINAAR